jgi:hypothetical protein
VCTLERNLFDGHDLDFATILAPEDALVTQECSVQTFGVERGTGEPGNPRFGSASQLRRNLIVEVQHCPVRATLVLEDSRFGINIRLEASVPVEMIGRDVQYHRDLRMKGLDGLKLKAGDFKHIEGIVSRIIHQEDHRSSDIAADEYALARSCYQVATKSGGRGLAV